MATWHQLQNPVPLYHETLWTVVTDPPNDMCYLTRFGAQAEADAFLAKARPHSYILAPSCGNTRPIS